MSDEDKLPAWAKERLDDEASMGGSFEGTPGERIACIIGGMFALAYHVLVWALAIAFVTFVIVFVAKAMGLLP